jgi:2-polyprenyl-3-methyl-5-hydroxy-6-metoxy-1,4-benzoquinol methylase
VLITDYYRQQNVELHAKRETYGSRVRSERYSEISGLVQPGDRILDYGCGKAEMSRRLENVTNYDPATYPELPSPHHVVVCMDVLEHVEPDCLKDVLKHLAELTQKVAYVVVSNAKHGKKLPDGRYSHLIVRPENWWLKRLASVFKEVQYGPVPADDLNDMTFICRP